jgi:hypothetical protein
MFPIRRKFVSFYVTVQELSARNVTKLLKELHGDNMDIIDVMNTLRDQNVLQQKVSELKHRDGMTDLVHFFEAELLGSMREKYQQFVIGLRAQLENIVSNDALRTIMIGRSNVNIDEHLETGGVLAVNTALRKLRKAGEAFGQFMIMHLQNGTFSFQCPVLSRGLDVLLQSFVLPHSRAILRNNFNDIIFPFLGY